MPHSSWLVLLFSLSLAAIMHAIEWEKQSISVHLPPSEPALIKAAIAFRLVPRLREQIPAVPAQR